MMRPTSLLNAKSSNVSIGGFILGTVNDEITMPAYEFTKTMAPKSQKPTRMRKEWRPKASLHPAKIGETCILQTNRLNWSKFTLVCHSIDDVNHTRTEVAKNVLSVFFHSFMMCVVIHDRCVVNETTTVDVPSKQCHPSHHENHDNKNPKPNLKLD